VRCNPTALTFDKLNLRNETAKTRPFASLSTSLATTNKLIEQAGMSPMATPLIEARSAGHSGRDLLTLSFSHFFDQERKSGQ
jgi:hypothetical protein